MPFDLFGMFRKKEHEKGEPGDPLSSGESPGASGAEGAAAGSSGGPIPDAAGARGKVGSRSGAPLREGFGEVPLSRRIRVTLSGIEETDTLDEGGIPAKIAIDLGTSASAVATIDPQDQTPVLADFGELGQLDSGRGHTPLIGSELYRLPASALGGLQSCELARCALGKIATRIHTEQLTRDRVLLVPDGKAGDGGGAGSGDNSTSGAGWAGPVVYTTSVKRLLDITDAPGNVASALGSVFLELLLLSLAPEKSATLRAAWRDTEGGKPDPNEETMKRIAWEKQVGFPPALRADLLDNIRHSGMILYLTVPNSFSWGEVEKIRSCAEAAGRQAMELCGLLGAVGAKPGINVLREAEAVAWWENFCAVQDGRPVKEEVWLVFDVGAGTTDLALMFVDGEYVRLITRSGLPIGGDDIDLLFIRHLANGRLRSALNSSAGKSGALGPDPGQLEKDLLTKLELAGKDTDKSFGGETSSTDRELWENLNQDEFLERLDNRKRLEAIRVARQYKLAWVGEMRRQKRPSCEARLDALFARDFKAKTSSTAEDLLDDHRYRRFVYLVTRGCCQGLYEALGSAPVPVRRVILSGRSARLPLLAEALRKELEGLGFAGPDTRYAFPSAELSSDEPSRVEDCKTAVVRGASIFARAGWESELPGLVQSEVVMELLMGLQPRAAYVFSRGASLDDQARGRRLYELLFDGAGRLPGRPTLSYYRQRLPISVVQELASGRGSGRMDSLRSSQVARKLLQTDTIPSKNLRVGLSLEEKEGRLERYMQAPDGRFVLAHPPSPRARVSRHPVTDLSEDWPWRGEGAPKPEDIG